MRLKGTEVLPPMEAAPAKRKSHAACGRFRTINTFADFTMRGLSRAEQAVWILLWRDTKGDGLAKASQANLAERAGIRERTARAAVKSLRDAGLLTVVSRGGLFVGPSVYRVHPLSH